MIIISPVNSVLCFVFIGIDVAVFFLTVRLIASWREVSWLVGFNKAGSLLTDSILETVKHCINRNLSERGSLVISITILSLVKLLILSLAGTGI